MRRTALAITALSLAVAGQALAISWTNEPPWDPDLCYWTGPTVLKAGQTGTFQAYATEKDSQYDPERVDDGVHADWQWSGGVANTSRTKANSYCTHSSYVSATCYWESAGYKSVFVTLDDCARFTGGTGTATDDGTLPLQTRSVEVVGVSTSEIQGPQVVLVGETATYTHTTIPTSHPEFMEWSGGGVPATITGDNTFTTKWNTPGTYTIRVECGTSSKEMAVKAIGGDYAYNRTFLRYYNGADPLPNGKATLMAAASQPSGTTYTWSVNNGPAVIEAGQNTVQAVLMANGASTNLFDVSVALTYTNSGVSGTYNSATFTALRPAALIGPYYGETVYYQDPPGFATIASYFVEDQFGLTMGNVPASETFEDDRVNYYANNNWNSPCATGDFFGLTVNDGMIAWGDWLQPSPGEPYSERVFCHTMHIWVGSSACDETGYQLKTHSQCFYRNRGAHE